MRLRGTMGVAEVCGSQPTLVNPYERRLSEEPGRPDVSAIVGCVFSLVGLAVLYAFQG